MSYEDWKRSSRQQWEWDETEELVARTRSPGKRTLTMSLPPRAEGSPAQAPVQRKAEPAAGVQRKQQAALTGQWMDTAFRPDLYGAPVQRSGGGTQPEDEVHRRAAEGISGTATALPHLDQIQRSFGNHDVSGVKAHVGGPAARANQAIGARAYASGDHVAFRSAPDLHTAAHEAAHVVQQRGGVQLKGGVGQAGDSYERHADAVADRVVQGRSAEPLLGQMAGAPQSSPGEVQRTLAVQKTGDGSDSSGGGSGGGSSEAPAPQGDDSEQGGGDATPQTLQGDIKRVEWGGSHAMTAFGGDDRVNPVWTPGATDHAAAYTQGTTPALNTRFELSAAAPSSVSEAQVQGKIAGNVVASGTAAVSGTALEASMSTSALPDSASLGRALYNMSWEVSVDGQTWSPLGNSGEHRIYWLVGSPQTTLYSLAADKVTQYAAHNADPAAAIRTGIHGDIPYDPSDGTLEANPLSMYSGGGHVCADFANLLAALGRAAGMSASPRIYFGGLSASGKMLWVREGTTGNSLVEVQPGDHSFTYHAIASVNGAVHDAALDRVGIDARAAMEGVNLELVEIDAAALPRGQVGQAYSHAVDRVSQAVTVQHKSFGGLLTNSSFGQVVPLNMPAGTSGTVSVPGDWYITGGALPAGLTLDFASGTISGTPTAAGTYTFTVLIDVGGGIRGSRELTLQIDP